MIDKDPESMVIARETLLEYILAASLRMIESLTDLKVNISIRQELSEALNPLLQTLCMLEYQRWQYTFELVPAIVGGHWNPLDPAEMEGMFAEENGWIKASLFPQLCRLEGNSRNEVSRAKYCSIARPLTSMQDIRRTVICKARVGVQKDVRSTTEEDTEMAEMINVEAEPDPASPKISKEGTTETTLEVIELEQAPVQSQGQVQDDVPREDLDGPMDEDSVCDPPADGSEAIIEDSGTPSMTAEDTEMAENSGVEAKTDSKLPESPREQATEKILETIELEQNPDWIQRQSQDAITQEGVGEAMNEDTMSVFSEEAGEEYCQTPERGSSEIVIPDSFDGAEEETVRSRSWPHY
jgi:hypothetical protein